MATVTLTLRVRRPWAYALAIAAWLRLPTVVSDWLCERAFVVD